MYYSALLPWTLGSFGGKQPGV